MGWEVRLFWKRTRGGQEGTVCGMACGKEREWDRCGVYSQLTLTTKSSGGGCKEEVNPAFSADEYLLTKRSGALSTWRGTFGSRPHMNLGPGIPAPTHGHRRNVPPKQTKGSSSLLCTAMPGPSKKTTDPDISSRDRSSVLRVVNQCDASGTPNYRADDVAGSRFPPADSAACHRRYRLKPGRVLP
jgi:hypothetical protein